MKIQQFLLILPILLANSLTNTMAASDLRKARVGTKIETKKGFSFSLFFRSQDGHEIWKDETSGILWSDRISKRIRRLGAEKLCSEKIAGENFVEKEHLNELPGLDDFLLAEKHGMREVLPNIQDSYYWIRSSVPDAPNIGHVFSGNLGKPILIVYRSINFENVRCISRLKK